MADTNLPIDLHGFHVAGLVTVTEHRVSFGLLSLYAGDDRVFGKLAEASTRAWPVVPNMVAFADEFSIAWLSPSNWALIGNYQRIADDLERACDGYLHYLADLSAAYRLWRLTGIAARDLIAKGCGLDTHPLVFVPGMCARTRMAQIDVLIVRNAREDSYDIIADASLSSYLGAWFAASTLIFDGTPVSAI